MNKILTWAERAVILFTVVILASILISELLAK